MSTSIAQPIPSAQEGPSLTLTGMLRNASTLYALEGLLVQAYYIEPPPAAGVQPPPPRLIGAARSNIGGSFVITWEQGPGTDQLLCLLAACAEAQYTVRVSTGADQPSLFSTLPAPAGGRAISLDLLIPIPAQAIGPALWNDLGARVLASGIVSLSPVIEQLALVPAAQSIFRDWPLLQRQNAVAQLETAFLDPHNTLSALAPLPAWQALEEPGGLEAYQKSLADAPNLPEVQAALREARQKLDAFSSLPAVDWQIDATLFGNGAAQAITANQNKYFGTFPNLAPLLSASAPEFGYRDYLRRQWTGMITLIAPSMTVVQAEQQLRNRLHQDFTTGDIATTTANEILIPILIEILNAAPGTTFGFGIPPASIPARGGTTAREYLNTLIGLSKLSARALTLRYRTDFTRSDAAQSSAVWENIHTLQGFFRDSFQSVIDPSHTDPDVLGQPIIPDKMQGKAPYFLEYDEWLLLQQPIPFENYVQFRSVFQMNVSADARKALSSLAGTNNHGAVSQFFVAALAVNDSLQEAYRSFDQGEYPAAIKAFDGIANTLISLLQDPIVGGADVAGTFSQRRNMKIASLGDLNKLLTLWQVNSTEGGFDLTDLSRSALDVQFGYYTSKLVCALIYVAVLGLPTIRAQASLARGDYASAIRPLGRAASLLVGKATTADKDAWRSYYMNIDLVYGYWLEFPLYSAGNLPYTVQTAPFAAYPVLGLTDDDSSYWVSRSWEFAFDTFARSLVPSGLHPVERAFYRLSMGDAMLAWADTLYRTDQASSISRARELYKGVYYLHGATPPINPAWPSATLATWSSFFPGYVNPAKASQLGRAQLGFTQIEAGLNYFGYADDMVPSLRYGTLKSAADAFAADAKSAERDFLNAMSMLESATIDNMKNSAMLQRAHLQLQVSQQQAKIANDQVTQANVLLAQVNTQIASVRKQIADHDSFGGQLGDYLSGMASLASGAGGLLGSWEKNAATAIGSEAGGSGALLGLSGGAAAMSGFVAFAVASYMTLSSMAQAQGQRGNQLRGLEDQNLPAANAQLDIALRTVSIAGLEQQIAQSDADLAISLLAYAQDRFLNIEFWSYMAALFRRTLRQYLDLAARTGWLAQRALAYELNAPVNTIGFDYYAAQYQGAGGADQLQLDLAVLEARHLAGLQEMVPVKLTYSLARDFPLQFAQLQVNGACLFQTSDAALQLAYPGTYGFRILAATPQLVRVNAVAPMRGLLANSGFSQISGRDGSLETSIRPADGLPISDFNIGTPDMNVFGLPGATLMQFEGSGIETIWQLVLPPAANPGGLASLADVLVTFHLRAQFAPTLQQAALGSMPTSLSKLILISASRQALAGLPDLQNKTVTSASLAFDIGALGLPKQEKTRTVNNLFVVLAGGSTMPAVAAQLTSLIPAKSIGFTLKTGVAFSNAPPITDPLSSAPPSPLNALSGIDANQTLTVNIDKAANPGVDFTAIVDVLLGVDYTATL